VERCPVFAINRSRQTQTIARQDSFLIEKAVSVGVIVTPQIKTGNDVGGAFPLLWPTEKGASLH
jgi:hypothetical protein